MATLFSSASSPVTTTATTRRPSVKSRLLATPATPLLLRQLRSSIPAAKSATKEVPAHRHAPSSGPPFEPRVQRPRRRLLRGQVRHSFDVAAPHDQVWHGAVHSHLARGRPIVPQQGRAQDGSPQSRVNGQRLPSVLEGGTVLPTESLTLLPNSAKSKLNPSSTMVSSRSSKSSGTSMARSPCALLLCVSFRLPQDSLFNLFSGGAGSTRGSDCQDQEAAYSCHGPPRTRSFLCVFKFIYSFPFPLVTFLFDRNANSLKKHKSLRAISSDSRAAQSYCAAHQMIAAWSARRSAPKTSQSATASANSSTTLDL